jgi:hypothetical protein
VTPQFGASLTGDSRVIIYDRDMFITQATGLLEAVFFNILFKVDVLFATSKQNSRHFHEANR